MSKAFWEEYAVVQWWDKEALEGYLERGVSDEEWEAFIEWVNNDEGLYEAGTRLLQDAADDWEQETRG